jgi:hypothetical protein
MADSRSNPRPATLWGLAANQPLASAANLGAGTRYYQTDTQIWQVLSDDNAGTRAWVDMVTAGYRFQTFRTSNADGTGTPGNVTQNTVSGRAAIAAAAQTCVVTNSLVATNSRVIATPLGVVGTGAEDATATRFWVSAINAGAFTYKSNAAATAACAFCYLVIN